MHDDLGQEGEARDVGFRLGREIHEQDVRRAQKILHLLGIGRQRDKCDIGAFAGQGLGIGGEVLVDEP